jgi:hypothetical protein
LLPTFWPGGGIFAHQVMADDYFNPALLDIDNPSREKPISPFMKKARSGAG